jgi:hypothetical protein
MTQSPNPPPSLIALRIIWAALIAGPVIFAAVVLNLTAHQKPKTLEPALLYFDVAWLAVAIPVAYIVRAIIYRKGRAPNGTVTAAAYGTGNIIFWAMCEGSAFLSLVCTMLNGGHGTPLLLAGIALAVQIANFPTGQPLREG